MVIVGVDLSRVQHYSRIIPTNNKCGPMPHSQLKALEQKIDDLINLCADLNRENASLKNDASSWHHERQQLLDNNDLAKNKVESIISRLRAMEQES